LYHHQAIANNQIQSLIQIKNQKNKIIFNQAVINKKYAVEEERINAPHKIHIFFLSFIQINILIKNNNIHIAQGLNQSSVQKIIVIIGNE
jgi:hypothetical protein